MYFLKLYIYCIMSHTYKIEGFQVRVDCGVQSDLDPCINKSDFSVCYNHGLKLTQVAII